MSDLPTASSVSVTAAGTLTKKELAARTVNRVRDCTQLSLATLLEIIQACGPDEGFFALTINSLFHPAEAVRLHVTEAEVPQVVRLLVLFAAVSLDKVEVRDADGSLKLDANGKPVTRKRTLSPSEFLQALSLAEVEYRDVFAAELAGLRQRWRDTLDNTVTHLLKAYDSSLVGRVRVSLPASHTPWLSGSSVRQFPEWVFAGNAALMKLSLLVQANFFVDGERLSLAQSLMQGDRRILLALVSAGVYRDETEAHEHFNTSAPVLPERVPSRAPQLLWDVAGETLAITPVASAAGLSALRALGRSGLRSRSLHYGGAQPQNVSAYMLAVQGDIQTPLSDVPRIDFSFTATTLNRIFTPRQLTRASGRWCNSRHLSGFEHRSNLWRKRQLQRLAALAVEKLAAPLFALRGLIDSGVELQPAQREAITRSEDPALRYAQGAATEDERAALAQRLTEEALKSFPKGTLTTEWTRYLTRVLDRELEFAQ